MMRHSVIPDVSPRPCQRSIASATAPLILDAARSSVRANHRGLRTPSVPPSVAPAGASRTIPHRLADDRDLVEVKFALLGAALVLVGFLR